MKHAFLTAALLGLLALVACERTLETPNPTTTDDEKLVTVRFDLGGATKALGAAIAATIPESVELTLTGVERRTTYTVTTGQPVTVPAGTYTVTAYYVPAKEPSICGFPEVYLSREPCFSIDETVTIEEGVGDYTLGATFHSWVVAVEEASASWTYFFNSGGDQGINTFLRDGTTRWVFVTGVLNNLYLGMKVDGAPYKLTTDAAFAATLTGATVITCSPGHWYVLGHTYGAPQSGGFSVNFPEWTEGE
jgi:hypothetical protein